MLSILKHPADRQSPDVSLINDFLISKGESSLGFLNLWLYDGPKGGLEGFTDIIRGSNPGCGTAGFRAVDGWDPVRPVALSLNFQR